MPIKLINYVKEDILPDYEPNLTLLNDTMYATAKEIGQ